MSLPDEIAAERVIMADLLAGLSDAQLDTPSLCAGWSVRVVGGHVLVPLAISRPRFLVALLRARGRLDGASDELARGVAARPVAALAALLRARAEAPSRAPDAQLADLQIHGQDIRRPLGLNRDFDAGRLHATLEFLTSPAARNGGVVRPGRLDGLRLVATDLGWSSGLGPELRGPAEALMLAIAGRTVALDELVGDGVAALAHRP
jgi:uncharacterized protein (TIGR03083 family)